MPAGEYKKINQTIRHARFVFGDNFLAITSFLEDKGYTEVTTKQVERVIEAQKANRRLTKGRLTEIFGITT